MRVTLFPSGVTRRTRRWRRYKSACLIVQEPFTNAAHVERHGRHAGCRSFQPDQTQGLGPDAREDQQIHGFKELRVRGG